MDFDEVRTFLAKLPSTATAALLASCCGRLVYLYDKEGEPSEAPGMVVACLSEVARGCHFDPAAGARCLELLKELLAVFGEAEDDLMVCCLATFKYALCAVLPPSDGADPALWGARCLSSFISTAGSLHHHRNGEGDWVASEEWWLQQAMGRAKQDDCSLKALRQVEPTAPQWERELTVRGVW